MKRQIGSRKWIEKTLLTFMFPILTLLLWFRHGWRMDFENYGTWYQFQITQERIRILLSLLILEGFQWFVVLWVGKKPNGLSSPTQDANVVSESSHGTINPVQTYVKLKNKTDFEIPKAIRYVNYMAVAAIILLSVLLSVLPTGPMEPVDTIAPLMQSLNLQLTVLYFVLLALDAGMTWYILKHCMY